MNATAAAEARYGKPTRRHVHHIGHNDRESVALAVPANPYFGSDSVLSAALRVRICLNFQSFLQCDASRDHALRPKMP